MTYFGHFHPQCSKIHPQLFTLPQLVSLFNPMESYLCCLYIHGWTIHRSVVAAPPMDHTFKTALLQKLPTANSFSDGVGTQGLSFPVWNVTHLP